MSVTDKGSAVVSSGKDDWQTPARILVPLAKFMNVHLDPCAGASTSIGECNIREADNGLTATWKGNVFVNPPYSELRKWSVKCMGELKWVKQMIILIPARTDTRACQPLLQNADKICFIKGRLKFVDPLFNEEAEASAPFPSALFYFGTGGARFAKSLGSLGAIR